MNATAHVSEHGLMAEMGLTAADIERRKKFVDLTPEDIVKIATIKDVMRDHAEELAAAFFNALNTTDAKGLMGNRELLEQARRLKVEHLHAMAEGEYGAAYAGQRVKLGRLYSRAGLEARVFFGAFHALLRGIGAAIMKHGDRSPALAFDSFMSLEKVAFFDIALIVDVLAFERERVIRQQQEAIRELTTPVLQVRDRLLLLPIIGVIDTHRARLITENLLRAIRANRAKVVVMDVTGVATIDSKVANHLLQAVAAARLMGAAVIVTGLSSDVATSLVVLGIELTKVTTAGDLQGGLEEAERLLGYRVVRAIEAPRSVNGDAADADLD